MTIYKATVIYKAFAEQTTLPEPMEVELAAESADEALGQLWERFNHAIPGVTGDLAEKFRVRSMCVSDEILLQVRGQESSARYVVAPIGFDLIGDGENEYAKPGSMWNPRVE